MRKQNFMKNLRKLIKETVSKVLGENDLLTHSIDESIRVLNNIFKDNLVARINETNDNIIDVYVKKYDIDTNKAVEFKHDKNFKLNKDPNFTDGYFTYDNIPPYAINFENIKSINLE